jgi:hypothetical protein
VNGRRRTGSSACLGEGLDGVRERLRRGTTASDGVAARAAGVLDVGRGSDEVLRGRRSSGGERERSGDDELHDGEQARRVQGFNSGWGSSRWSGHGGCGRGMNTSRARERERASL